MRIKLHYEEPSFIELPEDKEVHVYELPPVAAPDAEGLIRQALENPIGLPDFFAGIKPSDRLLLLCDDLTRQTRADLILPRLIPFFKERGIRDENIKIMIAYGTHRAMNREEKIEKLGQEIVDRYEVLDHDYHDKSSLRYIGKTLGGVDIEINKHLEEFSIILAVGQISPHPLAGWGGGCKMVMPGVSSKLTADQIHWLGAKATDELGNLVCLTAGPGEEGEDPNPMRRELEAVGMEAGLTAIFNVIQNTAGEMIAAVFGHPIAAFRQGVGIARERLCVKASRQYDLVIAESYPTDISFWQANKALRNAELLCREGGMVVLITPCPEGFVPDHPIIEEYGYISFAKADGLIREGVIDDYVAAGNMTTVGKILSTKSCVLVTKGIKKETCLKVGLGHEEDPAAAIAKALDKTKAQQIAVLLCGGETVPRVAKME
ncbi:MAG: nickel-dependent lactate racemase [Clostridiales bacterium]